jgi:hypothetical protein
MEKKERLPKILLWAGIIIVIIIILSLSSNDSSEPKSVQQLPESNSYAKPAAIDSAIDNKTEPQCHPSYSGCLRADASDYDCIGGSGNGPYYTGKVRVIGPDVFGLDRDGDGWGCE